MTDSDNDVLRRWLAEDPFVLNTVFLVAAGSLAVALTSCLWHHVYPSDPGFSVALSEAATQQPSLSNVSLTVEQKDRKGTRSKERRRRGKDPFRDLLKGGKKSKALVKAITVLEQDDPPLFVDASIPTSSTSRSQSPEPARDHFTPDTEFDDGPNCESAVISLGDISGYIPPGARSHAESARPHSCPPRSMTVTDTEVNISSASTVRGTCSSPSTSSPCTDVCIPQPCTSTTGSAVQTRLRGSEIDSSIMSSSPSFMTDSVASASPCIHSTVPCPSLSIVTSTNHSTLSTPTNSRGSSSPSRDPSDTEQPLVVTELSSMRDALEAARLREVQLCLEAQQASKERDELCWRWNEDVGVWRRREAELQAQIHHLAQQLQAYAAVASYQVQQASNLSSPTSPHAHSSPRLQHHPLAPFPLPPAIQTQNSASAPAHVQALLTCHPHGFASPSGFGSPLTWSGMGLCVPNRYGGRHTPDSSASGSSSRGRRRERRDNVKSASDESSLGDWDGLEDGSGDEDVWEEEEEDIIFRNNALADAILKRPESIRNLSGSVRKRTGTGRGTERKEREKEPAMEQHGLDTPTDVQS